MEKIKKILNWILIIVTFGLKLLTSKEQEKARQRKIRRNNYSRHNRKEDDLSK